MTLRVEKNIVPFFPPPTYSVSELILQIPAIIFSFIISKGLFSSLLYLLPLQSPA